MAWAGGPRRGGWVGLWGRVPRTQTSRAGTAARGGAGWARAGPRRRQSPGADSPLRRHCGSVTGVSRAGSAGQGDARGALASCAGAPWLPDRFHPLPALRGAGLCLFTVILAPARRTRSTTGRRRGKRGGVWKELWSLVRLSANLAPPTASLATLGKSLINIRVLRGAVILPAALLVYMEG